ncbi:hypothetical protein AB0M36_00740 [Actinoplanes sp. NPDC051346]|uniref:hypothetical protein n=1 Tax=Actinoplanes sp. NPDC051346 TaxID=3155048 RepID=UPI00344385CD
MRRLVFPAILASGLVVMGAVPASAEPAPAATSAKAAAGKKVCKVTDPLLNELSGIVATADGYVVINDSTDATRQKIFFLNKDCRIVDQQDFSGAGPRDTEDLILSPDGKTLWIADTGDNNVRTKDADPRETISVWTMPADGSKKPKIHRLAYPAGDKHDAEALLLDGSGKPIIVTKEITGPAYLYTPTAALKTNNTEGVPLKKVGQVELPRTDTQGTSFARLAQSVVTGAAVARGGRKVVLRTYLDAFEWDVTNGDVIGALKQKPRGTGLPNEPFGEAITYSVDGKTFATVSDFGQQEDEEAVNYILSYTPATKIVQASTKTAKDQSSAGPSWFSDLSLSDITYLVGGVGVLGAILVGAGAFGIIRARKKPLPAPAAKSADPAGPDPTDAETELLTVGGPPKNPGVYGAGAAASGPGVYGAKPPQKSGGVYGGAASGPGTGPQGRPGAAQPARPGAVQPGRPGAVPPGRPGVAQPGRPGGAGSGRPGAAQPGRPGVAQPARPGAVQPGRPGAVPPGRPGAAQPGRPGAGRSDAAHPGRPSGGSQGRPTGGGQPDRSDGAAPTRPPQNGQPGARPTGGGTPGGRGGVYGAPPAPPTAAGGRQAGSSRPTGPFGAGPRPGGAPSNGAMNAMNGVQQHDGRREGPGFSWPPQSR